MDAALTQYAGGYRDLSELEQLPASQFHRCERACTAGVGCACVHPMLVTIRTLSEVGREHECLSLVRRYYGGITEIPGEVVIAWYVPHSFKHGARRASS